MPTIKKTIASAKNKKPRLRANSGPTDDTLRQCGHRAKALFNVLNWKLVKHIVNTNKINSFQSRKEAMAYQKCIRAMATCNTMHARHGWHRRCHWTWRQIYDSFAIWSWACNSLRWILTYEQTIAWTSNIFLARRSISDWLENMD